MNFLVYINVSIRIQLDYRGKHRMYEIAIYKTSNGKEPYIEWLENLDKTVRARIRHVLQEFKRLITWELSNLLGMVFLN